MRTRQDNVAKRKQGRTPIAIVVVVMLVAVGGGIWWVSAHKSGQAAEPIPAATSAPDTVDVTVDRETATVLVGAESAPVTVDLYGDLLCPACRNFEQANGERVHQELADGAIRVRYHLLNMLDDRSDPPGYSLLAANAAMSVADVAPAKFLDYYESLYAAQPAEGARGYDREQLTALGNRLGVTDPRFAEQVKAGTFETAIRRGLATTLADPALRIRTPDGGSSFGTPTVTVDGARVDIGDPNWLATLTSAGQPDGS
jgi:Thioredoxin